MFHIMWSKICIKMNSYLLLCSSEIYEIFTEDSKLPGMRPSASGVKINETVLVFGNL